jgi:hypothetical protein
VWVKLTGSRAELDQITKEELSDKIGLTDFKLEKIYSDAKEIKNEPNTQITPAEMLDSMLDSEEDAEALKALWRDVYANS